MNKVIDMTKENLEKLWKQLDDTCGNIENAMINMSLMKGLPEELSNNDLNMHFSNILSLKNKVEELIEEKGGFTNGN